MPYLIYVDLIHLYSTLFNFLRLYSMHSTLFNFIQLYSTLFDLIRTYKLFDLIHWYVFTGVRVVLVYSVVFV